LDFERMGFFLKRSCHIIRQTSSNAQAQRNSLKLMTFCLLFSLIILCLDNRFNIVAKMHIN